MLCSTRRLVRNLLATAFQLRAELMRFRLRTGGAYDFPSRAAIRNFRDVGKETSMHDAAINRVAQPERIAPARHLRLAVGGHRCLLGVYFTLMSPRKASASHALSCRTSYGAY